MERRAVSQRMLSFLFVVDCIDLIVSRPTLSACRSPYCLKCYIHRKIILAKYCHWPDGYAWLNDYSTTVRRPQSRHENFSTWPVAVDRVVNYYICQTLKKHERVSSSVVEGTASAKIRCVSIKVKGDRQTAHTRRDVSVIISHRTRIQTTSRLVLTVFYQSLTLHRGLIWSRVTVLSPSW